MSEPNLEWLEPILHDYAMNLHAYSNGIPGHHNDYREQTDQTMAAITAKINEMQTKLLDNIQASLDSHTVPEGRDLLSRSYVNNTLEFERKRKDEVLK